MSNCKQVALAFQMYAQDYDETFPIAWQYANNSTGYIWADAILPYMKNLQILTCPSYKSATAQLYPTVNYFGFYNINRGLLGYACNTNYWGGNDGAGHTCSHPMGKGVSDVKVPAETIQFTDWTGGFEAAAQFTINSGYTSGNVNVFRHNGQCNVAFCDGHVKSMNQGSICQRNSVGVYRLFTIQED